MFDELQIDPDRVPLFKLIFHIVQIFVSLIAWCLEIVVFRAKDASVNGQNGWAFAVCFLSVPAWIYLIGAPRFPRTRRLAEPHVMVAVDVLFFILWLSAFAAQASFNSHDRCGHGCGASKGVVALGVFNTLFFGVTSFLSIYSLKHYQLNGSLPGYDRLLSAKGHGGGGGGGGGENIDPDMAAFSTAPHDEEPYARINNMDPDYDVEPQHDYHSGVGAGGSYGGPHSSYGGHDTGYMGAGGAAAASVAGSSTTGHPMDNPFADDVHALRPAASAASLGGASAAHSGYAPPTVHDAYDEDRPVRFPDANYDRR